MKTDQTKRPIQGEIMVIEDNASDLKLMTDILKRAGYKVRPASDGELALRSVQAKQPDLILLDVNLPDINGVEVCRRLKADPGTRDIPIIFISAMDETDLKVKALEEGGADYVTKPFEPTEILAKIGSHLDMHRMRQQLAAKSEELIQELKEREEIEKELQKHRKRLEELVEERTAKLRNNQTKLRKAQEIARLGRWELDLITNRLTCSDGICSLFDFDCETFSSSPSLEAFLQFVHPGDRRLVKRAYRDSVENKSPYEIDHRLMMRDGSSRWVNMIGRTEYDGEGNPSRFIGIIQDITERKKADKELRELNDRLSTVFNNAPNILVLVNAEGRVEDINRRGVEFAGRGKDKLLGLLGGEVFNCLNSYDGEGCGQNMECAQCPVRTRVDLTFQTGNPISEEEGRMTFVLEGKETMRDPSYIHGPGQRERGRQGASFHNG